VGLRIVAPCRRVSGYRIYRASSFRSDRYRALILSKVARSKTRLYNANGHWASATFRVR
jgi:hypothetical protein